MNEEMLAPPYVVLNIDCSPRGWARARRNGNRYFVDDATAELKRLIGQCWVEQTINSPASQWLPWDGPVMVAMTAYFAPPASWPKWKRWALEHHPETVNAFTAKPDIDNLSKLVFDALNGLAWRDDALVTTTRLDKIYHHEKEGYRLYIEPRPAMVRTKDELEARIAPEEGE